MTEQNSPDPGDNLDERLRRFRDKHDVASGRSQKPTSNQSGLGFAMRIGMELVAALIVGVGLGLLVDHWLGTKPWFMLVFFVLGAAAGMFNIYRVMSHQGGAVGYRKPAARNDTSAGDE